MNDALIQVAWLLLWDREEDAGQARSRRAVSTAYYALFHTLARSNADSLVGTDENDPSWARVYRALDHRNTKTVLERLSKVSVAPELKAFAEAYNELQLHRHAADYDPSPFDPERASLLVFQATQAIARFKSLSRAERLDLATLLLFKNRS